MNKMFGRLLGIWMVLVLVVSSLPVVSFAAESNTAKRHEVATTLSTQAKEYYTGNYTVEYLSALSGSDSGSSLLAMQSDLYKALHELMTTTMTQSVSYSSLTGYWPKTDTQNGGNTCTLFYSDVLSNDMNREHVWPKSRASYQQLNGGADLHHLRPTNQVINSTRGNYTFGYVNGVIPGCSTKAYGNSTETVIWYSGSEDRVEVRDNIKGDVARILLYVYVRWEQPNLFEKVSASHLPSNDPGSSNDGNAVIESLDTLLAWCALDPVDEWEMQRNDLTQNVQGNRNVFIDYPELAWLLFDRDIPQNMTTPGGLTPASSHTISAKSSDTAHGTVTVSGSTVTAMPANGYYACDYTLSPANAATVTRTGNNFVLSDVKENCTLTVRFEKKSAYSVKYFFADGSCTESSVYAEDSVTFPLGEPTEEYDFVGWSTVSLPSAATVLDAPLYMPGSSYSVTKDTVFYAVYSYAVSGGDGSSGVFAPVTEEKSDWSGRYVIAGSRANGENIHILNVTYSGEEIGSGKASNELDTSGITVKENEWQNVPNDYVVTIEPVAGTSYYTIRTSGAEGGNYLMYDPSGSSANNLSTTDSAASLNAQWSIAYISGNVSVTNAGNAARKLQYNSSNNMFRCYTSTQQPLKLYASKDVTIYYFTAKENTVVKDDCTGIDISRDGKFDIGDITALLDILSGLFSSDMADVNKDGVANIKDVTIVLNALSKYTGAHDMKVISVKEATCTNEGITVSECTYCGKRKEVTVLKTEHTYSSAGVVTVAATCEKDGVMTYTCTVCGEKCEEAILASGHSFDSGKITKAATCTEDGVKSYTCTVCKATKTEAVKAAGHSFTNGKCSVCGAEEGGVSEEKTVTITFDDDTKRTAFGDNSQVWEENGIVFTNDKASSTTKVANYFKPVRCYKGSDITVAYDGMKKIVFYCNAQYSQNGFVTGLVNAISDSGVTVTSEGTVVTVEFSTPRDSFTVTTLTAQMRFDSIEVYV